MLRTISESTSARERAAGLVRSAFTPAVDQACKKSNPRGFFRNYISSHLPSRRGDGRYRGRRDGGDGVRSTGHGRWWPEPESRELLVVRDPKGLAAQFDCESGSPRRFTYVGLRNVSETEGSRQKEHPELQTAARGALGLASSPTITARRLQRPRPVTRVGARARAADKTRVGACASAA